MTTGGPGDAGIVILIAEDDEGHAALIRRKLERHGVSNAVRYFRDGQGLLDYIYASGPAEGNGFDASGRYLLLLDIRMPKIDGVEVLRRIKEDGGFENIAIVMVTTTEDPQEIEKCFSLGCKSYLCKPLDYGELTSVIGTLGIELAQGENGEA